jgi:hypothetical protein
VTDSLEEQLEGSTICSGSGYELKAAKIKPEEENKSMGFLESKPNHTWSEIFGKYCMWLDQ